MKLSEALADIFSGLEKRDADILQRRYGLLGRGRESLQAIADDYGLTRERVRQLQNRSLAFVLPKLQNHSMTEELTREVVNYLGKLRVKREKSLLLQLSHHYQLQGDADLNVVIFFIRHSPTLGHSPESEHFHHFVAVNEHLIKLARHVLQRIHKKFLEDDERVWSEDKVIEFVQRELERHLKVRPSVEELFDFLRIIKTIAKNPFNQFGLNSNKFISPPSLREKIHLVLQMEKRPLHFREIYNRLKQFQDVKDEFITFHWRKGYNPESVHNQLISDPKIILAGRGLYALKEWGYFGGDTLTLMRQLVKKANQMDKEELWTAIRKQKLISRITFEVYLRRKDIFELDDQFVRLRHG
jgi:hypothetical protein